MSDENAVDGGDTQEQGGESGPEATILHAVGAVCARLLEQKSVIADKVKIKRKELVADVEAVHKVLFRMADELKQNSYLAPATQCKDLASNGANLAKVAKLAVSEDELQAIQRDLVSQLSSRRLVFEIENVTDKQDIFNTVDKAAQDLNALMEFLKQGMTDRGPSRSRFR